MTLDEIDKPLATFATGADHKTRRVRSCGWIRNRGKRRSADL
ncbi:hypothetical protein RSSM_05064 [Rhodopirellula sallentina SM41]|uniref:Uncharacterized protein n=1 Tax=Rhodopirellula sallentina SM41 TaxID=1263870 RepID=M5TWF7_9BACT|nr:hypothetical protein RSSM_05064 [Rhodopirellula sallentina SM41]